MRLFFIQIFRIQGFSRYGQHIQDVYRPQAAVMISGILDKLIAPLPMQARVSLLLLVSTSPRPVQFDLARISHQAA